ncbi:MAG TPA: hypothetical protein VNS22_11595 [Geminicoccus sp.]|uniref:hypothetical protein n=1 Tax=Geminicoccus sp. TaxID=2024832 RepID=UPI002C0D102D|nr:hypothetical protein [Geminicoccus sp.]HWL69015.1 hypothetical protein [Geminicoccus sp.]
MRLLPLALAAALLLAPPALRAETLVETFDGGPALDGILTPGSDGTWELRIANGVAELENRSDAAAIKFYRIETLHGRASPEGAAIAADVGGEFPGKVSAAGLLYRYDEASRSYLAFVAGAQRWALFQRGPEGMRPRLSGTLPEGKEGRHRLRIEPDGEDLRLEIDGQQVGTARISGMPGHAVGLVAMSVGRFEFDNLAIVPDAS